MPVALDRKGVDPLPAGGAGRAPPPRLASLVDPAVLAGVTGGADNETHVALPNGTRIDRSQSDREFAQDYATQACTEANKRFFGLWQNDPKPCIDNFMQQYDASTGGTR